MSDSVGVYLNEIGKVPLLTATELFTRRCDTVGVSATERIQVRHTTSRRFANTPVLLATLPGA